MDRVYKGPKKQAVQLTSLLDLLFVMIFVSLIQQKNTSTEVKTPEKPKIVKKEVIVPQKVEKIFFSIRSTFNFYATNSNPNLPNGSYIMSGSYNKETGELKLGGVGWVKRPKHYDMVPLSGTIDKSQKYFKGRIEFQGCEEFILERKTTASTTPISGDWVGSYQCSQGSTGLTLTIQ